MKTVALFVLATSVSSAFAAPFFDKAANVPALAKRSHVDYGPTPPVNCTANPSGCPPSPGPSGTLNYPNDGAVISSSWDNGGYVDVSYTPVNTDVGDGHVSTTSVIFTLRQYFYGVPAFDDKVRVLAALGVPDDYSAVKARLTLPGRAYDGDNDDSNDYELGGGGFDESVGEWGFEVVEQQAWKKNRSSSDPAVLIEFMSARPLVNITYIAPHA
ncbi:hypothetical protein T439DRAFT_328167 [Meredithblackwellia eburnea MCA 4105]